MNHTVRKELNNMLRSATLVEIVKYDEADFFMILGALCKRLYYNIEESKT